MKTAIVWFRQDLRLEDNQALSHAVASGYKIVPLFVWAPEEEGDWPVGGAGKWWLHQSLLRLDGQLKVKNIPFLICSGETSSVIRSVVKATSASAVFWNRRYEPKIIARDKRLKEELRMEGQEVESFNSALLFEPWEIKTKAGTPYKVYTPFQKACLSQPPPEKPLPVPKGMEAPEFSKQKLSKLSDLGLDVSVSELGLEPKIKWEEGIAAAWAPGAVGAATELRRFIKEGVDSYKEGRDLPARVGTSRLSPHLHFGEISVRAVWHELAKVSSSPSLTTYRAELIWREFAYHLLFHFPETPKKPLRAEFSKFPWKRNKRLLTAWQKGMTGYPMVDAGMRELWHTGWMHNRVRMVVASFLVKHLLVPWQDGAEWFWDTLVDADLASNTLGWQWSSGCGADAAPFFRIFNPVMQGEKFDPQGVYVKRWCPELSGLPPKWIHCPWQAPAAVLAEAGIKLGKEYPQPIVDHSDARAAALEAYEELKLKE